MLSRPHFLYRFKLIFVYLLVKLKFIQSILPKKLRDQLPIGWNTKMFWVAFKSGGQKVYFEYYCKMREPDSFQPKVVVDENYRLTEKDIRSFHENGYIGPFDIVPPEQIEELREHLVDLVLNKDSSIYSLEKSSSNLKTEQKYLDKNGKLKLDSEAQKLIASRLNAKERHLDDSALMDLFKSPAITERCAQILGPDLLLWRSYFFNTPALSQGTCWHQTSTWLSSDMKDSLLQPPNVEEMFHITCWIALTDAPQQKSCMKFIPGSRQEIYPVKYNSQLGDGDRIYGQYGVELDYPVDDKLVSIVEAKAGQCIIFCERTVHASTDNITSDDRWAVVGRIVKPDTKIFTKKMLDEGFGIEIYGTEKISLDNWKAVLLRGEDRYGYNRVLKDPS